MAALFLVTETGQRIEVPGPDATLGRDPSCDVFIDDRSVSRTHAALSVRNGTWWIRDTASANGVVVDDRMVAEAELRHGQVLSLGHVRLQVSLLDDDGSTLLVDARALRQAGATGHPAAVSPDARWLWLLVGGGLAGLFVVAGVVALVLVQRWNRSPPRDAAATAPAVASASPRAIDTLAGEVPEPVDDTAPAPARQATPLVASRPSAEERRSVPEAVAPPPAGVPTAPQVAPPPEPRAPPVAAPTSAPRPTAPLAPAPVAAPPVTPPRQPSPEPTSPVAIPPEQVVETVRTAAREVDAGSFVAAATRLLQLAARLEASGDAPGAARLRVYAGVALVGSGQTDTARELFAEALGVLGRRVKVVSDDFSPQSRDVLILAAELLNATPMPGEGPD